MLANPTVLLSDWGWAADGAGVRSHGGPGAVWAAFARAPLHRHGWREALGRLREHLGCAETALLLIDAAANRLSGVTSGADPKAERHYLAACGAAADTDPRAAFAFRAPQDQVWTDDDLDPAVRQAAADFYAEVLEPIRADHVRGVVLARDGARQLALVSTDGAGAEDAGAAARFVAALPAVRSALEVEAALLREGRDRAMTLIAGLQAPAMLLAADGRVLSSTEAAMSLLASSEEVAVVDGRLATPLPPLGATLVQALAQAADPLAPRAGVVRTEQHLILSVTPLTRKRRLTLAEEPAVAVLIGFDEAGRRLQALGRRAGLSRAELDIVRLLVEGRSADQIAERRGAARETVRTQLKSIYVKTGSSSRADLLRAYYAGADGASD